MASEFDIETAIIHTLKALPLVVTLHHVMGHKDKQQPKTYLLPWEAQLNIICDCLAGYQLENCSLNPVVTPNPLCQAYVSAKSKSITNMSETSFSTPPANPPPRTLPNDTTGHQRHFFLSIGMHTKEPKSHPILKYTGTLLDS
jgi:hypothetical protein